MSLSSALARNRAAYGLLQDGLTETAAIPLPDIGGEPLPAAERYALFARDMAIPGESFAAEPIAYPALPDRPITAPDDPVDLLVRRLETEARRQPQREEEF